MNHSTTCVETMVPKGDARIGVGIVVLPKRCVKLFSLSGNGLTRHFHYSSYRCDQHYVGCAYVQMQEMCQGRVEGTLYNMYVIVEI
jgi:hypothetical protein